MLKYECIGEVTLPLTQQSQGAGQRADKGAGQWDMVFLWQSVPIVPSALHFHLATVTDGSNESPRIQQALWKPEMLVYADRSR